MSDLDFNSNEYYAEISDLAANLYDEALEQNDNDHESAMDAIHDYMLQEISHLASDLYDEALEKSAVTMRLILSAMTERAKRWQHTKN